MDCRPLSQGLSNQSSPGSLYHDLYHHLFHSLENAFSSVRNELLFIVNFLK